MLMRGIQPPRLGSVRDRIMTEMYARERAIEHDSLVTITLVLANLLGTTKETGERIQSVLQRHQERVTHQVWSVEAKKAEIVQKQNDLDILAKVNQLGRK